MSDSRPCWVMNTSALAKTSVGLRRSNSGDNSISLLLYFCSLFGKFFLYQSLFFPSFVTHSFWIVIYIFYLYFSIVFSVFDPSFLLHFLPTSRCFLIYGCPKVFNFAAIARLWMGSSIPRSSPPRMPWMNLHLGKKVISWLTCNTDSVWVSRWWQSPALRCRVLQVQTCGRPGMLHLQDPQINMSATILVLEFGFCSWTWHY